MSERSKHLFRFKAAQIAAAAYDEAAYHSERVEYWQSELEKATAIVEKTASLRVERQPITGGWTPVVAVNYGDPAAYERMGYAGRKIQSHQNARDRYMSDRALYETQGVYAYELDAEDVAHFRLNLRPREE